MIRIQKVFPGGKFKVLTMSYDDGKIYDRRLVEIFNRYGIRGTFNLNGGLCMDNSVRIPPTEWQELYRGHEVAAHTLTHPTIDRCPDAQIISEMLEDRKFLENVMGYPVRGIAYPNGSCNRRIKEIAKMIGFAYGRTVNDSFAMVHATHLAGADSQGQVPIGDETGFALPEDFLAWKATCHHKHNLLQYGKTFKELFKKQYLYLMYVWGHSYELEENDGWQLMEEFCRMIGGRDDIWYATNIEIVDYLNAFDQLQFAADMSFVYNPSANSVWLTANGTLVELGGGTTVSLKPYEK